MKYDVFVIGAGPGGYTAALRAAGKGLKTAIAEERESGGTCLNRGCVPAKALINAADKLRELKKTDKLGIHMDNVSINYTELEAYKDNIIMKLRSGIDNLLEKNKNIDVYHGHAIVCAKGQVKIDNQIYEADSIIIASGGKPAVPPIPGAIDSGSNAGINVLQPDILTSDTLFERIATPLSSLIIIGGGVIGVEFASIYEALGAKVTVIEALPSLLPMMDKEISQNLKMIMKKRGMDILTSTSVTSIEHNDNGVAVYFKDKDGIMQEPVKAEAVLIATGRKANTEDLFTEDMVQNISQTDNEQENGTGEKIRIRRGTIVVDEHMETDIKGIYAIGDVTGGIQLAHVASAEACNVINTIIKKTGYLAEESSDECYTDYILDLIPSCVYTEPEIACIGYTETEAKNAGISVKSGKAVMGANARSVISDEERGFIKLVFNAETDILIGAQLMCARATDIISELANAVVNKADKKSLMRVVRAHPTYYEAIGEIFTDR